MKTKSFSEESRFAKAENTGEPGLKQQSQNPSVEQSAPPCGSRFEADEELLDAGLGNRLAPCPEQPTTTKRKAVIFVPTDFSQDSIPAVKAAVTMARRTGGQVVLFHAVYLNLTPYGPANPAWLKEALRHEASEKAEPLMHFAQAAGVTVTCVIEEGVQALTILKSAARWKADIIVLTSHRRNWLGRLFRRDTVEQVVRKAACPVMVLQRDGSS